ncbi:hypothetical protein ACJ72_04181 [Emergomyces africanus]|uniref:Uncharacterized protein n=1 Tax=Emergomyces africanus TaxID=1955775 RepID=A0A1B7NXH7_9EURO|nr:hypothetical protein ACJ72_04181 [Emergomyces africanus]
MAPSRSRRYTENGQGHLLMKPDAPIIIPENEAEAYGIQQGQVKRKEEQGGGFYTNV